MKTNIKLFYVLLPAFIFFHSPSSSGQEYFNLSAGAGLPDLLNAGGRYQLEQAQIGISAGFVPAHNVWAVTGDFFYHFGGYSYINDRRPWYIRTGTTYYREETDENIFKYLFLNIRIGREFNLSRKVGIQFDLGYAHFLIREEIDKVPPPPPSPWNFDFGPDFDEWPGYPGLNLGIFYRL